MKYTRHTLVMAVAMLMTACATNKGDVALSTIAPSIVNTPKEPTYQDVETPKRTEQQTAAIMTPALGFEAKLIERNSHPDSTENRKSFVVDDIALIVDDLNSINNRHKRLLNRSTRSYGTIEGTHDHAGGWYASRNRDYMKFVKSGWIADLDTRMQADYGKKQILRGMEGYVFYLGSSPAKALPAGKIFYKGSWDFATDAKKDRASLVAGTGYGAKAKNGDYYGAFSYNESLGDDVKLHKNGKKTDPVSHSSEFEVNFDDKTLTGKLKHNVDNGADGIQNITSKDRYTIDAKLSGNRFHGKAKAVDSSDVYFGQSSNMLEGGFFGGNAEELAGKFLTDDYSLFAVFAARQNKDGSYDAIAKATPAFDAIKIDNKSNFSKSELQTFGDATKLVINGRSFSLLSNDSKFLVAKSYAFTNGSKLVINVCCDNFSYIKFGNYYKDEDGDKNDSNLFLTGERTPLTQMTSTGQYAYVGTWEANILTVSKKGGIVSPMAGESGSRAKFEVDFSNKTLTGMLYQTNGVRPAINITQGVIDGNGFSAKFATPESGFVLDPATSDVAHLSGQVTGAFYGPDASELGGYFNSTDRNKDRVSGVFGGKKQVKKK